MIKQSEFKTNLHRYIVGRGKSCFDLTEIDFIFKASIFKCQIMTKALAISWTEWWIQAKRYIQSVQKETQTFK